MYHELTYRQHNRRIAKRIIAFVILVVLVAAAVFAATIAQASAREQAALSVRESVLTAAKQCCAVEGAYPSSLAHLEEHYGLTINHDDFIVNYEWFADNVLPAVVVVTR